MFKQVDAGFRGFDLHPGAEISSRQQVFHIVTGFIFSQHRFNLNNGLGELPTPGIHLRQRAARQADLGRFQPITAAIQALQLTLYPAIRRVNIKGALHVPDGSLEVFLLVADDAHPQMRDEIIRRGQ